MDRERFEQAMLERQRKMEQYGYIVDSVFGYDVEVSHNFGKGIFFNIHTHGLKKNFNHPEVQIILPLADQVASGIMNTVVEKFVVNGDGLKDGQVIKDLFNPGFDIVIKHHQQLNAYGEQEEFMRVMIPDEQNNIPTVGEAPDSLYAYQRENIYPASENNIH